MPSVHSDHMVARHCRMLTTGEYSDLTVICCGEEFRVHRMILCPASKFFKAASEKKFRVRKTPAAVPRRRLLIGNNQSGRGDWDNLPRGG